MENMEQAKLKMASLEQQLRERGVVDVKFAKGPEFNDLSQLDKARDICAVVEAVLDGRTAPAGLLGDSVRSPITFSPVTRCDGAGDTGDYNEEQQKGGTTAS